MKVRYNSETGLLGKVFPDELIVPEPYITLTEKEINNISNQNDKVAFVIDGQIIFKDKAEIEQKEEEVKELTRIAMLHMTKYDFFTYVCKPYGISYTQLEQVVNANEDLKAAWNLCNHVYRGNKDLNDYILTVIPSLTKEKLTEIFEEHNAD